jgi:hypothetical protein
MGVMGTAAATGTDVAVGMGVDSDSPPQARITNVEIAANVRRTAFLLICG